jgi:hypothetical protein
LSDLSAVIATGGVREITEALDAASEADRIAVVQAMSRNAQKRLWSVASAGSLAGGELIMADATERFAGRNSLALFSRFEKWFFRSGERTFGMNRHALRPLIGPGYFGVQERPSGGLVFDYGKLPDAAPQAWPAVRSNDKGLARAVYGGLVDEVVWVSRDVLVGAAFRDGRPMDSYFVLARREAKG